MLGVLIFICCLFSSLASFGIYGGIRIFTTDYGPEPETEFNPDDLPDVVIKGTDARYIWFGHEDESTQLVIDRIIVLDRLKRDMKEEFENSKVTTGTNYYELDLGKQAKYKTLYIVNTAGDYNTAKGAVLRVYDESKTLLHQSRPTSRAWSAYEYDFIARKWRERKREDLID